MVRLWLIYRICCGCGCGGGREQMMMLLHALSCVRRRLQVRDGAYKYVCYIGIDDY